MISEVANFLLAERKYILYLKVVGMDDQRVFCAFSLAIEPLVPGAVKCDVRRKATDFVQVELSGPGSMVVNTCHPCIRNLERDKS